MFLQLDSPSLSSLSLLNGISGPMGAEPMKCVKRGNSPFIPQRALKRGSRYEAIQDLHTAGMLF